MIIPLDILPNSARQSLRARLFVSVHGRGREPHANNSVIRESRSNPLAEPKRPRRRTMKPASHSQSLPVPLVQERVKSGTGGPGPGAACGDREWNWGLRNAHWLHRLTSGVSLPYGLPT
jgi:hypothetical protein